MGDYLVRGTSPTRLQVITTAVRSLVASSPATPACGLYYHMPRKSQDLFRRNRLEDSFREPSSSTRLPDFDLTVGRYFDSPGHITQDMLVSVMRSGLRDATDRRGSERPR